MPSGLLPWPGARGSEVTRSIPPGGPGLAQGLVRGLICHFVYHQKGPSSVHTVQPGLPPHSDTHSRTSPQMPSTSGFSLDTSVGTWPPTGSLSAPPPTLYNCPRVRTGKLCSPGEQGEGMTQASWGWSLSTSPCPGPPRLHPTPRHMGTDGPLRRWLSCALSTCCPARWQGGRPGPASHSPAGLPVHTCSNRGAGSDTECAWLPYPLGSALLCWRTAGSGD